MINLQSYMAKCTGYYPTSPEIAHTREGRMEGGPVDRREQPLRTLQRFIAGSDSYVSVAVDRLLEIPYGTLIFIPSFDLKYGKQIIFRVVDCGGAFEGKGWNKLDICVADKHASLDEFLNQIHEIVPIMVNGID